MVRSLSEGLGLLERDLVKSKGGGRLPSSVDAVVGLAGSDPWKGADAKTSDGLRVRVRRREKMRPSDS